MANECVVGGEVMTNDHYLCPIHLRELVGALNEVPELLDELEITFTKQSRTGGDSVKVAGGRDCVLPWDEGASTARRALTLAVAKWATLAAGHRSGRPTDTGDLASWLASMPSQIGVTPDVGDMFDEITGGVKLARWAIDSRPARVFIGICSAVVADGAEPCIADLYAVAGRPHARCRVCGTEHDVEERRGVLLAALDDVLAPQDTLVGLVNHLGHATTSATIRSWERRGQLLSHGIDRQGRKLFRVGDVLDRITRTRRPANVVA